jgi:hypothetical protein
MGAVFERLAQAFFVDCQTRRNALGLESRWGFSASNV